MKVILYMEVTANGFIARQDNDTDWISDEAWNSYTQITAGMDAIIIGKNTYDLMPEGEFQKEVDYIIVTSSNIQEKKAENLLSSNLDPSKIIEQLKNKNYHNVCVAGGANINSQFMKVGLVDEIYLDIEPFVFGSGIPLFESADFEYKLELLESKKLNKNTIQLHYKVLNKSFT